MLGIGKDMKRFKIYDTRDMKAVAWASNAEELAAALSKYPISGWYEATDTTNGHRVGIADGRVFDRDLESFVHPSN